MSLGILKEEQALTNYSIFHMRASDIHNNVGYLLIGDSVNIKLEGIDNIRDTLNKEKFILCAYEENDVHTSGPLIGIGARFASGDVKTAVVFGHLIDIGVKYENILISYSAFSGKPALAFDDYGRPQLDVENVMFNEYATNMMFRQTLLTYSLKKLGVLNNFQNKQKVMDAIELCSEEAVFSINKDVLMHELIKFEHMIESNEALFNNSKFLGPADKSKILLDKSISILKNSTYIKDGLMTLHKCIYKMLTSLKSNGAEDGELIDTLTNIYKATALSVGTFVLRGVSKKRDEGRLSMTANLSVVTGFRGNETTHKLAFDVSRLYEVNGYKEILIHGRFICNELGQKTLLNLQHALFDNELYLMSVVGDNPLYGDTNYMIIFTQNKDAINIINKLYAGIYEISDIRSNL